MTSIGFIIFELCGSTDIHHPPNISERRRTPSQTVIIVDRHYGYSQHHIFLCLPP